jgi:DNA-binding NtrC family response regulator
VRELRNVLERAANISSGNYINPEHLPDFINNKFYISNNNENICTLKNIVAEAEIKAIMEALRLSGGNRTVAARRLGIHRTALYKKLESYGISISHM